MLFLLFSLFARTSLFADDQNPAAFLENEPLVVLGLGQDQEVPRIRDLVIDDQNQIYALGREDGKIYKFDSKGKLLKRFGGFGQGPGELMEPDEMLWVEGRLWISDAEMGVIHLFKDDRLEKRVKVKGIPYSITRFEGQVCVAPMSFYGTFTNLSTEGKTLGTFKVDPNIVDVPNQKRPALWGMFQTAPLENGQLFVGFRFLPLTMTTQRDGTFSNPWSMDTYYTAKPTESGNGLLPGFFAAISFSAATENRVWIAACGDEDKQCDTLYLADPVKQRILHRQETKHNLRKIKLLKDHNIMVVIDDEYKVYLYRYKQPST